MGVLGLGASRRCAKGAQYTPPMDQGVALINLGHMLWGLKKFPGPSAVRPQHTPNPVPPPNPYPL